MEYEACLRDRGCGAYPTLRIETLSRSLKKQAQQLLSLVSRTNRKDAMPRWWKLANEISTFRMAMRSSTKQ